MEILFRSKSLLVLTFVYVNVHTTFGQLMKGGIINLAGDTITCKIASTPKDAGLKRQIGTYHYDYVVAVFNNDSSTHLYPGNIKGYYYHWNSENTPMVNRYFSESINARFDMMFKKPPLMQPLFLQSLVTGGHYHLWYFEQPDPGARNDRNFILEESSTGKKIYFHSTKGLKKILGDWPGSNKQDARYKDWFKGKQWMVIDYNKYKSEK